VIRTCKGCSRGWRVDDAEQQRCRSAGVSLPRTCLTCRADKRKLEDRTVACARCGTDFEFTREFAILCASVGWGEPTRCISGCDEKARKGLRGDRRKMADAWDRMRSATGPAHLGTEPRPVKPEDLFRGLDKMLEKAAAAERAAEEAAAAEPEPEPEVEAAGDGPPDFSPRARKGEDLPSPDDLFKGLLGDRRKSKG